MAKLERAPWVGGLAGPQAGQDWNINKVFRAHRRQGTRQAGKWFLLTQPIASLPARPPALLPDLPPLWEVGGE